MPYVVRRGSLHYEPRTGNGPCSRAQAGEPNRRVVQGWHVTKGRRQAAPPAGRELLLVPPSRLRPDHDAQIARRLRNTPHASVPGGLRRRRARGIAFTAAILESA